MLVNFRRLVPNSGFGNQGKSAVIQVGTPRKRSLLMNPRFASEGKKCKGRAMSASPGRIFVELGARQVANCGRSEKSGRSGRRNRACRNSKTHEAEKVRAALDAGQEVFGESRVQKRARRSRCCLQAALAFVGRPPEKKSVTRFLSSSFPQLDSIELAREMNRIAAEQGSHPRVLRKLTWR